MARWVSASILDDFPTRVGMARNRRELIIRVISPPAWGWPDHMAHLIMPEISPPAWGWPDPAHDF